MTDFSIHHYYYYYYFAFFNWPLNERKTLTEGEKLELQKYDKIYSAPQKCKSKKFI